MRYLLVFSAILSLANFGFSESSISSCSEDQVILIKSTSGGRGPMEMEGWGQEILVYESGTIMIRTRANKESPWIDTTLGVLAQEVVDGIEADLAGLRSGEIVFPDQEGCFDMPTTSYAGMNELNEPVRFALFSKCLLGELAGFADGWRLKNLLDGLESLALFLTFSPA